MRMREKKFEVNSHYKPAYSDVRGLTNAGNCTEAPY